jgi:hypothetical protein
MRSILLVLPLLALVGCSSTAVSPENLKPVPSDRLLAFQQPVTGGGTITVNRDHGMLGGGCYVGVTIDHQLAARIAIGETASFNLSPGMHVAGIVTDEQDDTLCGMGRLRREKPVTVVTDRISVLRIQSEAKSGFDIVPASQ